MPEAKIVLVNETYNRYYRSYVPTHILDSITDWEEVTEEELSLLRRYISRLPLPGENLSYLLLVKDDKPIHRKINSIRKLIEEEKEKEVKEKRKKEETNRKRQETKRKNQEEKEQKELERLKKKYEQKEG